MPNQSTVTEFLLLGFSDVRELQILHFVVFLVIYVAALVGNLLIISAIVLDHRLHTPMYFLLGNLSILDICYISVAVPKSMANSWNNTQRISFPGCVAQVYFGLYFASAELCLLMAMAYDRYVAICHPLRYRLIMAGGACAQMAAGSWIASSIYSLLHTANTFRLPFCGSNAISQFFCDMPLLLKLACADTHANEIVVILCSAFGGLIFFISILVSYIHIFLAVLRIPTSQGRYKAFFTCLPHLVVFWLFISTGIYTYLQTRSATTQSEGMLAAVLYTIVSPVLNPLIYSLRNKEIKDALGRILIKMIFTKSTFT
nr:olfactory receptor 14I1-like [Pelodiscus sinensis]|eukprot:XP_014424382.1 olfactory receptor 14I1-like [Pelodiscus sinensis]